MDFYNMLNNAYNELYDLNQKSSNCDEINKLVIPTLITEKTPTRLHWVNTSSLLDVINRQPNHLLHFLKYELSNKEINWMSSNINDGLIIHGKNIKKELISELVLKYVNTFVICSSCKSYNTTLDKFNSKKYNFLCNNCKMTKVI
jgi:translation initiation factor 2 beta subunit (eIF-2beta)/eIF-5